MPDFIVRQWRRLTAFFWRQVFEPGHGAYPEDFAKQDERWRRFTYILAIVIAVSIATWLTSVCIVGIRHVTVTFCTTDVGRWMLPRQATFCEVPSLDGPSHSRADFNVTHDPTLAEPLQALLKAPTQLAANYHDLVSHRKRIQAIPEFRDDDLLKAVDDVMQALEVYQPHTEKFVDQLCRAMDSINFNFQVFADYFKKYTTTRGRPSEWWLKVFVFPMSEALKDLDEACGWNIFTSPAPPEWQRQAEMKYIFEVHFRESSKDLHSLISGYLRHEPPTLSRRIAITSSTARQAWRAADAKLKQRRQKIVDNANLGQSFLLMTGGAPQAVIELDDLIRLNERILRDIEVTESYRNHTIKIFARLQDELHLLRDHFLHDFTKADLYLDTGNGTESTRQRLNSAVANYWASISQLNPFGEVQAPWMRQRALIEQQFKVRTGLTMDDTIRQVLEIGKRWEKDQQKQARKKSREGRSSTKVAQGAVGATTTTAKREL